LVRPSTSMAFALSLMQGEVGASWRTSQGKIG